MTDERLPIGTRVGCASGRGTIIAHPRRASADIRTAATERERDMRPYTVRMDRTGTVLAFRGHELDVID
jgi:hypothetical protein